MSYEKILYSTLAHGSKLLTSFFRNFQQKSCYHCKKVIMGDYYVEDGKIICQDCHYNNRPLLIRK